jgi:hemoglobin
MKFRMLRAVLALGAFAAGLCLTTAHAQEPAPAPPGEQPVAPYEISNENAGATPVAGTALFEAFHGQEGIGRIVDGTVDRSLADPRITEIFKPFDMVRLRRTLREQVCYLLGGPCQYTGRTMADAHRDMGVQTRDFNVLVEHLRAAMDQEGVPFRDQNRLLALLAPMHREVVQP